MITSTTDVYLIVFVTIVLVLLAGLIHYNGFKMGYKMGLKKGFTEVNKHTLEINKSQHERIMQLMKEVNLQNCKRGD